MAPEGAVYVFERWRALAERTPGIWQNTNLRTHLLRLIERAGLKPWPRLFHNLRSSRQTELEETFPTHVVCAWLGNSPQIANRHYLQVTDEHFMRAMQEPANPPSGKNLATAALRVAAEEQSGGENAASYCEILLPPALGMAAGGHQ